MSLSMSSVSCQVHFSGSQGWGRAGEGWMETEFKMKGASSSLAPGVDGTGRTHGKQVLANSNRGSPCNRLLMRHSIKVPTYSFSCLP